MACLLEVALDNFEGVLRAIEGGANRIELCSALSEGGLTPSFGFARWTIDYVRHHVRNMDVFVMIRNRRGDFILSEIDIKVMESDIRALKKEGAGGFVFGALTKDGDLDMDACQRLIKCAAPLPCTLHRCVDQSCNYQKNIKDAAAVGFRRVLTSGAANSASEGCVTIADAIDMLHKAKSNMIIMPGGGVTRWNIANIVRLTKCREIHSSAKIERFSDMHWIVPKEIEFGRVQRQGDEENAVSPSERTARSLERSVVASSVQTLETPTSYSQPLEPTGDSKTSEWLFTSTDDTGEKRPFRSDYDYYTVSAEEVITMKMMTSKMLVQQAQRPVLAEIEKGRSSPRKQ